MRKKPVVVTVTGKYLGKAEALQYTISGKLLLITSKLRILKAIPVTNLDDDTLIQIKRTLEEEIKQQQGIYLYLVAATAEYKQYEINEDDILPACSEGGEVIVLLRNEQWLKVPLEAIGAQPDEVNLIAKYNTMYHAALRTLQLYQAKIQDYRRAAIRFAEYARRLEADLSVLNKTVIELQDAVGKLHSEINSLLATTKNYEQYTTAKERETEFWKRAYFSLVEKINKLTDLVPRIIELTNKLATAQLEREVEFESIKADIAKLQKELQDIGTKLESIEKGKVPITETAVTKSEEKTEGGETGGEEAEISEKELLE